MKISELFYSFQGEGKRSGVPSFFIRTNFCNLRCKFPGNNLCDTPYTSWEPNDAGNWGEMDIPEIVSRFKNVNCNDVVITGGEPTMYPQDIKMLASELKRFKPNVCITVETNGTSSGDFFDEIDLISVSPKLSTSTPFDTDYEKMHEANRLNLEALIEINIRKEKKINDVQWKFVFTGDKDLTEIQELQKSIGFKNKDVYLMPEGISKEDLEKNRLSTVEACLKLGWGYTDRLHIMVWGNKRGT